MMHLGRAKCLRPRPPFLRQRAQTEKGQLDSAAGCVASGADSAVPTFLVTDFLIFKCKMEGVAARASAMASWSSSLDRIETCATKKKKKRFGVSVIRSLWDSKLVQK
jgi:hypothetical protein